MPIFETLVTSLGLSIAKATLKCWLKDSELAQNVTSDLLGLIHQRFVDYRERASTQRNFARLAEKAAESLDYIFQREFRTLDEGAKIAVIQSVSEGINAFKLDSKLLATLNLDPQQLFTSIRKSMHVRLFQENEVEFLDRVLMESCSLIADFSSNLPGFTERTLGEVLSREAVIIQKLDQVIEQIQQVRDTTSSEGLGAEARFEESYRRQVSRKLDEIELFGASDLISAGSRRHNLTLAYISLSAIRRSPQSKRHDEDTPKQTDAISVGTSPVELVGGVEACLCNDRRLLVRGEAGSGKTTLLQFVAVRSATGTFDGTFGSLNRTIPFFIRLRQFAEKPLPQPEDFLGLIAPIIKAAMPAGWVNKVLTIGEGLVLIDGVDELDESKRSAVHEWVRDLVQEFPESRFMITSRPAAIKGSWLSSEGFSELELLPLQPPEVDSFIEHWHEAVASEEADSEKRSQIPIDGQLLKARIRDDRPLRELATTPLLCGMICAMHRERRHALPNSRISLYEAALAMLLHRRDQERRIIFSDLPTIELEEKQALLEELAMWLMDNGWASTQEERAATKLQSILSGFPRLPKNLDGGTVLKVLLQRSGILRSPVEGVVDFVHKTFQEFLCAKAIVPADRLPYLLDRALQERWRDVAVLAAGLASETRREEFITGLLEKGDTWLSRQTVFYLLALACLETAVRLSPTLQNEIVRRLEKLHPPQNISEAKALSRAGDLALGLLKRFKGQKATCAAACVRALRLIGSQWALEQLKDYGDDERITVAQEVVEAWPYFGSEPYAREVLSRGIGLRGTIGIGQNQECKGLRYLRRISGLTLWLGPRTLVQERLCEACQLYQLRFLRIVGQQQKLDDLSFLVGMKNLARLTLEIPFESAAGLERLMKLRSFTASQAPEGTETRIRELPELQALVLREASFTKLPKLQSAARLERLYLHSPGLSDVSCLSDMTSLTDLSIIGNEESGNEDSIIGSLAELRRLVYRPRKGVSSLEFVRGLSNLRHLVVQCQGNVTEISPVLGSETLSQLVLFGIENLTIPNGFSHLGALTQLALPNLKSGPGSDIDFLPSGLQVLYVSRAAYRFWNDRKFKFRVAAYGA